MPTHIHLLKESPAIQNAALSATGYHVSIISGRKYKNKNTKITEQPLVAQCFTDFNKYPSVVSNVGQTHSDMMTFTPQALLPYKRRKGG
jgi:hypothetical protein